MHAYLVWSPIDCPQAHGLGSSHNYYTPLAHTLTSAGYTCIAYDLHGSSHSPYTYVAQTVASLAQDAIDLLDALSVPTATFVGHSMSGITGPELAASFPDRITAIVLIGPVYPSESLAPVFEDRIAKVTANGMEAMADTIPFSALGSRAGALHRAFVRELIMGVEAQGYVGLCAVIAGAWKAKPNYARIQCPVLVVAGDEDKSAPLEGCERIVKEVASQKKDLKVLKEVGHWHCVEAPEETAERIMEFLASA